MSNHYSDIEEEYYAKLEKDMSNLRAPCWDDHNVDDWKEYTEGLVKKPYTQVKPWKSESKVDPVEIPDTFSHFHEVLHKACQSGKYPANNWLEPNGYNTDKKSMYASIFRHCAEAYAGVRLDKESGLDPRLHAAVRLMMDYTRDYRGIKNDKDK